MVTESIRPGWTIEALVSSAIMFIFGLSGPYFFLYPAIRQSSQTQAFDDLFLWPIIK